MLFKVKQNMMLHNLDLEVGEVYNSNDFPPGLYESLSSAGILDDSYKALAELVGTGSGGGASEEQMAEINQKIYDLQLLAGGISLAPSTSETITVSGSVVRLTSNSAFTRAVVSIDNNSVRFFTTGASPTITSGHLVSPGDIVLLHGTSEIDNFKAIAVSGQASLQVTYYVDADGSIPSTPKGFTIVEGDKSLVLSWTANTESDLLGYNVYQNGVKVANAITGTSHTITGLTNGTQYSVQVSAVNLQNAESPKTPAITGTPYDVKLKVNDTFTRADNATSMGTSESGQSWSGLGGTWGIIDGQAYNPSATSNGAVVIESGVKDGSVEANVLMVSANSTSDFAGLVIRAADAANFISIRGDSLSRFVVHKRIANVSTVLGYASKTYTAGQVLNVKLVFNQKNIEVYFDGTKSTTITLDDSDYQVFKDNTKHGLYSKSFAGQRWDNFQVRSL